MLPRRRRELGTRAVVTLEAAVDDRARDRLAAGAAELALGAEQEIKMPAGTCNRQAAMKAGRGRRFYYETVMRRPAPLDFFGSTSFSTPSLYSALTALSSTSIGSVKLRETMP
jgi:hypothetical protein